MNGLININIYDYYTCLRGSHIICSIRTHKHILTYRHPLARSITLIYIYWDIALEQALSRPDTHWMFSGRWQPLHIATHRNSSSQSARTLTNIWHILSEQGFQVFGTWDDRNITITCNIPLFLHCVFLVSVFIFMATTKARGTQKHSIYWQHIKNVT